MARSNFGQNQIDLQSDGGTVLWSIIQGEQLEYPITLDFLTNADAGYTYEAVIVEGANIANDESVPSVARTGGNNLTLVVRVPLEKGAWSAATAYNREDVVSYNGLYYKLFSGTNRVSAVLPTVDTAYWVLHEPNKVYIQFPDTLTLTPAWLVQPTLISDVYGFFELSVKEPAGGVFQRTWKPMRGLVAFKYSPTQVVP